jgi:N-acetyl sugar amidotransferase
MQHNCPKCNYPKTHPFGLIITTDECSGCVTHAEKNSIDWQLKKESLEQELLQYKKKGQKYDCVVPVVGDAEDYFTLSKVLELGLSPLVVCVNDYFKNDIGWKNFHQLINYFDVDSFTFNPDIRVYKDLVRTSLRKFDHIMLPFLQLHTSFPVHVAYERNIPLVIWGQNQAVEQVGKFSHHDAAQMSKWHRKAHDLFNVDIDGLIGNGAQVKLRDLNYYRYPDISALNKRGVKGLYLSNYFRWDPLAQNKGVLKFGFQPEVNNSSFDIYERAGSSVYYQLHDLLKYKRIGYRKITDHVAREIRHNRLTIDEGIKINRIYTERKVHIKPFFDWLGVTASGYEWFKKHRLNGVSELISETPIETESIKLPNTLEQMLVDAVAPIEHHVLFGKGIYI